MSVSDRRCVRERQPAPLTAILRAFGVPYWTAALLPALVGTVLPFWLRPPGFSFRWLAAGELLLAAVLLCAGFSALLTRFAADARGPRGRRWLTVAACASIATACALGWHLNGSIPFHPSVPRGIFLVYGLGSLFAGVLYAVPPFSFWRRVGGEVVVAYALGLLPVLGAYLVQVGDLTRTAYAAAAPIVVATGLWVWLEELASREEDEKTGRRTLVLLLGPRLAGGPVVLALSGLYYLVTAAGILTGSLSPLAAATLLLVGLVWSLVAGAWQECASDERRLPLCRRAFLLHLATCLIVAASCLAKLRLPATFSLHG